MPGQRIVLTEANLTKHGEWSLVCQYWMPDETTAATRDGMAFSNDPGRVR